MSSTFSQSKTSPFVKGDGIGGEGRCFMPSGTHTYSMIFLHGLGDTAHGWSELALELKSCNNGDQIKFIFPTAKVQPVQLNLGFPSNAWADIWGIGESVSEDLKGYLESVQRIHSIIDNEVKLGIKPKNIIIGGFSQGGATAYLSALSHTHSMLGGLIVLSGWLPLRQVISQTENNPFLKKQSENGESDKSSSETQSTQTQVLHCHGKEDPLVMEEWGKKTFLHIQSNFKQFPIEFKSFQNLGHSYNEEEAVEIKKFVNKVFS